MSEPTQDDVNAALSETIGAQEIVSSSSMVSKKNAPIKDLLALKTVVDDATRFAAGTKRGRLIRFGGDQ